MNKVSDVSPVVFFQQYESFREAAEALTPKNSRTGTLDVEIFFKRLNPLYFLIGHATECLLKSCLLPNKGGHDLRKIYKTFTKKTGLRLSQENERFLFELRELYHPGREVNTVRYPGNGSKSFRMPSHALDLLNEMQKLIEPLVRETEKEYLKTYREQSRTQTITG